MKNLYRRISILLIITTIPILINSEDAAYSNSTGIPNNQVESPAPSTESTSNQDTSLQNDTPQYQADTPIDQSQNTANNTNSSSNSIRKVFAAPCLACRCYRINCSRIENPDIDCENDYKDTCDHQNEITEETDCNLQCNCCLKGECHSWSSYFCIMFRTFEIVTTVNFLLISVSYFAVWRAFKHFFYLRSNVYDTKDEAKDSKKHKRMTDGRNFYKYQQILWIIWNPTEDKKNVDDPKINLIGGLAAQVNTLKPLAIKNAVVVFMLTGLWIACSTMNIFCIIALADEPFKFALIVWIQHALTILFWALAIIVFYYQPCYRIQVLALFTDFEENNNYTISIKRRAQNFEIKPKRVKDFDNNSQKELAKQLTEDDSYSADSSKEFEGKQFETKINRVDIKDEKPKLKLNQVKPL
jgi:hypothetical protein